jgi:uncharacterized protein (DUF1501 family)
MTFSRRQFMIGCSATVAAMAGGKLAGLAFADPAGSVKRDLLVVIFLRGGMDGLNLVAPVDDRDYVAARSAGLCIGANGENTGLPLGNAYPGHDFRLHAKAAGLKELYDSKDLAIVHACGLTNGTRSHFEAMDLIERGVADMKQLGLSTGWLTRHLAAINSPGLLPAICTSDGVPASLLGSNSAAAMGRLSDFNFYGDEKQAAVLRAFYANGDDPLRRAGTRTLQTIATVGGKLGRNEKGDLPNYVPENKAAYPQGDFGDALQTVARIVKLDLGLEVAAVDFGGWDMHQGQSGYFPALTEQLSGAISGFYNDLSKYHQKMTMVVLSEFGRRVKCNESDGTDHGHGNAMLVLGGHVNGGRCHGLWPGLATEQLDARADLAVTTDYRHVLAEILTQRAANPRMAEVFPGMQELKPLGLFKSMDTGAKG